MKLEGLFRFSRRDAPGPDRQPRTSATERVRWCAAVLLGLVGILPLLSKISPITNVPKWDEFIVVYDAHRVVTGQVPYRDFFNFIPPGIFFLLAGWFGVLGHAASLTLGRYLAVLLTLAAWALILRVLRRAAWPTLDALLLASIFSAACYPFWAIPSHHWLSCLVFMAAFEAYDFEKSRVRGLPAWAALGLLMGLALLSLQTVFLSMLTLWGIVLLLSGRGRPARGTALALGFTVGSGPVLIWLASKGAAGAFLEDVFIWTAGHYRMEGSINAVPLLGDLPERTASLWSAVGSFPALLQAVSGSATYVGLSTAGLLLVGLFLTRVVSCVRERRFPSPLAAGIMAMTAVELAMYLRGKSDWLHLVYLIPRVGLPWLLVLGVRRPEGNGLKMGWRLALAGFLAGAVLFHAAGLFRQPSAWEFLDVDRTSREAPINVWLRAQPWLEARDTVAAFPEGGEVYLYVRPAAVGFTLLLSPREGYQSQDQYALAASQIEESRPRCVILTTEQEEEYLAQGPLAQVIREKYDRYAVLGDAVIFRRRLSP